MSWLLYLSCSPPTQTTFPEWLFFIFLSPCPQHLLFSFVNLLFILTLFLFFLHNLFFKHSISNETKPLLPNTQCSTWRFKLPLLLSSLLAVFFLLLSILTILSSCSCYCSFCIVQTITLFLQSISNLAAATIIAHKKRPLTLLRIYWAASFLVSLILSTSSIIRLAFRSPFVVHDIISIIFLLFYSALLAFSISPSTSDHFFRTNVTGYSAASFLSRLTWSWMNPLLTKGYKTPLKLEDVPALSPEHRAELLFNRFASKWPHTATKSNQPVRMTLLRCLWPQLLLSSSLAIVRLCVMYVGPTLINRFIDLTSGRSSSPYEGYC